MQIYKWFHDVFKIKNENDNDDNNDIQQVQFAENQYEITQNTVYLKGLSIIYALKYDGEGNPTNFPSENKNLTHMEVVPVNVVRPGLMQYVFYYVFCCILKK